MASSRSAACVFIVAVTMAAIAAGKSTSPPATTTDCTTLVMEMADCLSFVTNSTVAKPEGNCCSGLKKVLKTNPNCLCEMFKSSADFGITVNVTKAATLPAACKVHAPSVDKCGISLSPVAAPAPAPTPSSGGGMSGPPAAAPANKGSPPTTGFSIGFVFALIAGAIVTSF